MDPQTLPQPQPTGDNTMQPENNMAPATAMSNQAATSESTSNSVTPEAVTPQTTNMPARPSALKKLTQQWYFWVIVGLAAFCVLSAAWLGYMLNANAESQIKINELNQTIAEKDALLAKYIAQLGQTVDDAAHPGYIDESGLTTRDFLYVGAWGLKFKIPTELKQISYSFKTETIAEDDGTTREVEQLCVTGMPSEATRLPEYLQAESTQMDLGCIVKQPDNNLGTDTQAKSVYQDGTSYYIYHRQSKIVSTTQEDREWEIRAIDLVQELLAHNITKFD